MSYYFRDRSAYFFLLRIKLEITLYAITQKSHQKASKMKLTSQYFNRSFKMSLFINLGPVYNAIVRIDSSRGV